MDTINVKAMFESLAGNFQDVLNSYRVFVCLNAAELYKNQPEPTISFNLDIADRKCTVDNLPVVLERGVHARYLIIAICAISEKPNPRWKDHVCLGRIFEDLGDDIFKKDYYNPLIQLIEEKPKEEGVESLRKIRDKLVAHFSTVPRMSNDDIYPILTQMYRCFLEINDRFNMNSEGIEKIREEKIGLDNIIENLKRI